VTGVFRLLAAVSLLVPIEGHAQQAVPVNNKPQATPSVTLRTQADIVLLDVVVTADKTAVHGLNQDKFQIYDDGKLQSMTVFEEHNPGDAPVVAKVPNLGPNIYSNVPEFNVGSAANVLLLDALNTPLADQQYVRQQMIQYLKTIPPGTRIAVFTLASRLRMVEGFTTDAGVVAASLTGKGGAQQSAVLDPQFDQELSNQVNVMQGLGASQNAISSMQQFLADNTSFQTDVRVRMTLDALQGLARYLNVIPGRKNLIWFSGSFPLSIDPDSTLSSPFEAMRGYASDVRLTDGMLSAARVAVYPVDARGVLTSPGSNVTSSFSTGSLGDATSSGSGRKGGRRGSRAGHSPTSNPADTSAGQAAISADNKFLSQTAREHDSMQLIAEDTGGEAFFNTNEIKDAVAQAIANGASYYTVGYSPHLDNHDGRFHQLKVVVDGRYQTAYRHGYYAEDLAKAKIDPLASQHLINTALQQGSPPLSEILFKVRVQTAGTATTAAIKTSTDATGAADNIVKGEVRHYVIDYGIPMHGLDFRSTTDGMHHGRLEFVLVAYNADGKRVNLVDQNANFDLIPALYDQFIHSALPMRQEIDLPTGRESLRIVVYDLNNEHVGAIEVPVIVQAK
jgi:VWFA-related protein